jgi:putative ABC transport system permease protein
MDEFLSQLRAGLPPDNPQADRIVAEAEDHLQDAVERLIEQGLSRLEAEDQAIARFGTVEQIIQGFAGEETPKKVQPVGRAPLADHQSNHEIIPRKRKGVEMFADILPDIRFAGRMLRKNPGFALIAVLTLALGIGANTAMFSIINGVLLRPLPYFEPDQLVRINPRWNNFGFGSMNAWEYFDILEKTTSFEKVSLYRNTSVNLTEGNGEPERVSGVRTTPSLLTVLGVQPALGRALQPGEGFAGDHRVALISDRLWKGRFGADPAVVGRTLRMLNDSYEIIGVMPAGFAYPHKSVDIWAGYGIDRNNLGGRGGHSSSVLARLKKGVSTESAQAELTTLSAQLRNEFSQNYPEGSGFTFIARPLMDVVTGTVKPALLLLMGAVGFVLLIACANVANLLLARITAREREIAIRTALGASQGRILRQILTETFLLSALGGLGALAFAAMAFKGLTLLHPESVPRLAEVRMNSQVLLFNLALVTFATLIVGLIPSLRLNDVVLHDRLKEGGRQGGGALRHRTRAALVVTEVALATVLLMGAGLLIRSFQQLTEVDPGFRAENILTTQMSLSAERYPELAARSRFFRQATEELAAQPGVLSAGFVNLLPMSRTNSDWSLAAEGYSTATALPDFIQYRMVTPDYFKTMGIPVLHGRAFTSQDTDESPPVAIISASMATKFWGEQDPVGRRVKPGGLDSSAPWHTVVGVVGDIHHDGAREGKVPVWYRSIYANSWSWMHLAVRSSSDPALTMQTIRTVLKRIDPNQPVFNTKVMTQMVAETLTQERFNTNLLIAFAGLALGLAAIGIFGVIGYSVSQRTREIGIRMALGAHPAKILRQVMQEGLTLIFIGLGLGVIGALVLTRFMETLLFGVSPTDPVTFFSIAAVLVLSGAAACFVPARRATQVDPMVALRYE